MVSLTNCFNSANFSELSMLSLTNRFSGANFSLKKYYALAGLPHFCEATSSAAPGPTCFKEEEHNCCCCCLQSTQLLSFSFRSPLMQKTLQSS